MNNDTSATRRILANVKSHARTCFAHATDEGIVDVSFARGLLLALVDPRDDGKEGAGELVMLEVDREQEQLDALIEAAGDRVHPAVVEAVRARLVRKEVVARELYHAGSRNHREPAEA